MSRYSTPLTRRIRRAYWSAWTPDRITAALCVPAAVALYYGGTLTP